MSKPNQDRTLCQFNITNFPRKLKAKYAAYCRANDTLILDHLQYLIAKELREAGVNIPSIIRHKETR